MKFSEQDASAVKAYAGTYEKQLFSTLRNSITILDDVDLRVGVKNQTNLTKLMVKHGIRAYRQAFDAADDDLHFSGRTLSVKLLKRDMLVSPLEFRETWMSEHMKQGVNGDDIPFAEYISNEITKTIAQEVNDNAYFAKEDDGSTIGKCFDGLGTIIDKAITAETTTNGTGLVPVATGVITKANAVEKFEAMLEAMPSAYIDSGFNLYCSSDLWRKYQADYRERYGKYTGPSDQGLFYLDSALDKVQLKPCSWMRKSQRIIATPKENLLAGVDGMGDMDKMSVFFKHEIFEWRWIFALGFQIRDLEAIRVNDQA
ncbi:MAG: hypothetical protein U0X71_05820 [Sphingobacteriaceae bacterium]|jgi:hypothetical protein|nr:MAG: hypothetical protein E6Q66_10190 [Pedobacter sp.]